MTGTQGVGRVSALAVAVRWLHAVALSLWLGGLVAIGAVVAPAAFSVLGSSNPQLAGRIVGDSLRVFNGVCYVCGGLLLLSQLLLWTRSPRRPAALCLLTTLFLLGTAVYQGQVLFPHMDALQASGQRAAFDILHRRYEAVSVDVQLPLLLLLTLLAAVRDAPSRPLPVSS